MVAAFPRFFAYQTIEEPQCRTVAILLTASLRVVLETRISSAYRHQGDGMTEITLGTRAEAV
jgi:hypothetical protein